MLHNCYLSKYFLLGMINSCCVHVFECEGVEKVIRYFTSVLLRNL